jgi:hypothetical protein
MVHGYLPGTILSARELTGPAAWFALEGRTGFHGTDNPVAFFNQFFARHGAGAIGISLCVDRFSPLSSQNMRHLNRLPVISGLFHPPLIAPVDTAPIALAGDLVRTGYQGGATVPGWSSTVGGWVMNP